MCQFNVRQIIPVLVTLVLLSNMGAVLAAPMRVLFIGNSYTTVNDLPKFTEWLASSEKRKLETTTIATNGYTLEDHWNAGQAVAAIRQGGWDYVVLQEQSVRPIHQTEYYYAYFKAFDQEVRKVKAKTVLYQTWARRDMGDPISTQSTWTKVFSKIARETKAIVAPVGEARANVLRKNPKIDLFDSDGSHPSYSGTYLAACVFYSVFYGKSSVGLSVPSYISPTSYGAILQRASWDTVKLF